MSNANLTHISYGELTALSQSKQEKKQVGEALSHIQKCEICEKLYEKIATSLSEQKITDYEKSAAILPDHCCQKDSIFTPHFFLAFLLKNLDEDSACRYFLHLNNCYPCFELFSRSWSDYLSFDPDAQKGD